MDTGGQGAWPRARVLGTVFPACPDRRERSERRRNSRSELPSLLRQPFHNQQRRVVVQRLTAGVDLHSLEERLARGFG